MTPFAQLEKSAFAKLIGKGLSSIARRAVSVRPKGTPPPLPRSTPPPLPGTPPPLPRSTPPPLPGTPPPLPGTPLPIAGTPPPGNIGGIVFNTSDDVVRKAFQGSGAQRFFRSPEGAFTQIAAYGRNPNMLKDFQALNYRAATSPKHSFARGNLADIIRRERAVARNAFANAPTIKMTAK